MRFAVLLVALPLCLGAVREASAFTIIPNQISISGVTASEGTGGATTFSFNVTVTRSNCATFSVTYATASGTATAIEDFFPASGTLNFSTALACPSTQTLPIEVTVASDSDPEPNETFTVTLTGISPSGVTLIDTGVATGIIQNDDGAVPTITVGAANVVEGDSGNTTMNFRATLSAASTLPVSFAYQTTDGTATAGTDYTRTSGRATFSAGTTSLNVSVVVLGDTIDEDDETFTLGVSSPLNAAIAVRSATGTILDDDGPRLSISDVSVTEGDTGTVVAAFDVRMNTTSAQVVTVDYETVDDTAESGRDYTATRGTLTFPLRSTTQTIRVPVAGDVLDENDETFRVTLSNPVGATIADTDGQGTIVDDDPAPTVSISDARATEGTGAPTTMAFTVALSEASGRTITVGWATAEGTATAADDFTAGQGVLTFSPGVTTRTITVVLTADALDEDDETFSVSLRTPSNVTILRGTAEGTIVDDDATPTLGISASSVNEGDSGTSSASFVVTMSAISGLTATVEWTTAAGTATAPDDFRSSSGVLTFSPGNASRTISVPVNGDTIDEPDETFTVRLSNARNATIQTAVATGTILDDDDPPSITIRNTTVTEGDSGIVQAAFSVSLSAASSRPISVGWRTADATAKQPGDYLSASGTLTFDAGETSGTIRVDVEGDTLDEPNETFRVILESPVNATIAGTGQGTGTIRDDDAAPAVSIRGTTVTEGDAGQGPMRFGVSLSSASSYEITVDFATQDGSARQGQDYVAKTGTLVFAAGEVSKSIEIEFLDDTVAEDDEQFSVALSAPTRATLDPSGAEATGTIQDDEARPDLTIAVTAQEPWIIGEPDEYRFQISNVGSEASVGAIQVRQTFPSGLAVASATGEDWSCVVSDDDLACSTDRVLAPGLILPEVLVAATAGAATFPTLTLTATVTVLNDARVANDANSTQVAVLARSDVALNLWATSGNIYSPTSTDPIRVVLVVLNAGPNAISELHLALSSTPASIEALSYWPGEGSFDAETGVWSDLQLTASSTVSLEILFDVPVSIRAEGSLSIDAEVSVSASYVDPNLVDNTASLTLLFSGATDGGQGGGDAGSEGDVGPRPDGGEACPDDDDGLAASEEAELGTDPCDADSDDDGLSDFLEVKGGYPTNPLDPDTDHDGLCDGPTTVGDRCIAGEDTNANGRVDVGETNPRDPDSDDGGVNDGEEVKRGTDPLASQDDALESCDCRTVPGAHGRSHSNGTARGTLALLLFFAGTRLTRRNRRTHRDRG